MSRFFPSPRFVICLLTGSLALGCLLAEKPRYPELDDPFGPRHGPPPRMSADLPERQPAPPPPKANERQMDASELIDNLEDSSQQYDEPPSEVTMQQLQALERFLNTPPEQLARIRETIERVEAMSEEEKDALRAKIRTFRTLQRDKMEKLRDIHRLWQDVPRRDRHLVHRYMMSLPREEAAAVRVEIAQLDQRQFDEYFQGLLAKARAADEAGGLPNLADSVRRWRRDRNEPPGGQDRSGSEQMNTRKSRPE